MKFRTSLLLSSLFCCFASGVFAQTTPAATATVAPTATAAITAVAPYKVTDGYKVDAETMKGFRAWRAADCARCHGANQEGLVGPSLVNSLKIMDKNAFINTMRTGRIDKGMPSFAEVPNVMNSIEPLYIYLKGRSDGAITRAKVEEAK